MDLELILFKINKELFSLLVYSTFADIAETDKSIVKNIVGIKKTLNFLSIKFPPFVSLSNTLSILYNDNIEEESKSNG